LKTWRVLIGRRPLNTRIRMIGRLVIWISSWRRSHATMVIGCSRRVVSLRCAPAPSMRRWTAVIVSPVIWRRRWRSTSRVRGRRARIVPVISTTVGRRPGLTRLRRRRRRRIAMSFVRRRRVIRRKLASVMRRRRPPTWLLPFSAGVSFRCHV